MLCCTLAKKQTRPPSYRNGAGVTEFLNDGSTTGDGLESKEQQKGHHKTEQTHSLRKGKSQNGV